jgi:hypothetical protein
VWLEIYPPIDDVRCPLSAVRCQKLHVKVETVQGPNYSTVYTHSAGRRPEVDPSAPAPHCVQWEDGGCEATRARPRGEPHGLFVAVGRSTECEVHSTVVLTVLKRRGEERGEERRGEERRGRGRAKPGTSGSGRPFAAAGHWLP